MAEDSDVRVVNYRKFHSEPCQTIAKAHNPGFLSRWGGRGVNGLFRTLGREDAMCILFLRGCRSRKNYIFIFFIITIIIIIRIAILMILAIITNDGQATIVMTMIATVRMMTVPQIKDDQSGGGLRF